MTLTADDNFLAAEYALGTLSAPEIALAQSRAASEPEFAEAVADWQEILSPLTEDIAPVTPPPELYAQIAHRLGFPPAPVPGRRAFVEAAGNVVTLRLRLRLWRTVALGAGALAASLVAAIGVRQMTRPESPGQFVAVLQQGAAQPAFIMTVDVAARSFAIRPVAAQSQPGRSYQLWMIAGQLGAPRSLGLIGDAPFTVSPEAMRAFPPAVIESATFAVTSEPAGGSPTGQPTSAPLFTGRLIRAVP